MLKSNSKVVLLNYLRNSSWDSAEGALSPIVKWCSLVTSEISLWDSFLIPHPTLTCVYLYVQVSEYIYMLLHVIGHNFAYNGPCLSPKFSGHGVS